MTWCILPNMKCHLINMKILMTWCIEKAQKKLEMTVWKIRMILYMITRKMRMTGKIMFSANYPGATTNFVCGKRDNYFYHFSL